MILNVSSIDSFCTLITTCSLNGIKDIRVFISENNVRETRTKFTYVLFTPLYTAIYSRTVDNDEYETIYHNLELTKENSNHCFRIQEFDKIIFDSDNNTLSIGKETNVI